MNNSNLISLLKTFTKSEMKEFDKFLRSPYFTEGKGLRHRVIYDYFVCLREFYPEFTGKTFSKEYLHSRIYPSTGYNDAVMRRLNYDLLTLTKRFITQLEFEESSAITKRNLLIQLTKRKTDKLYITHFKEITNYLEKIDKDEEYFYEIYNTWKVYWGYFLSSIKI
jgi:hypothetical protein